MAYQQDPSERAGHEPQSRRRDDRYDRDHRNDRGNGKRSDVDRHSGHDRRPHDAHKRRERDGRSRSPERRDSNGKHNARRRSPPPRTSRDERRPTSRDRGRRERSDSRDDRTRRSAQDRPIPTQPPEPVFVPDPNEDPETAEIRRTMGFGKFRSTKNTKVPGNDLNYAVSKPKKIEYRQYMNRTGGFNRPLSPSRI